MVIRNGSKRINTTNNADQIEEVNAMDVPKQMLHLKISSTGSSCVNNKPARLTVDNKVIISAIFSLYPSCILFCFVLFCLFVCL